MYLNFLSLKIFFYAQYRYQKSKKLYHYLLLNLMISDLILIVPTFPLAAINSFYGKWVFNNFGKYSLFYYSKQKPLRLYL